jgi:hypothetical protein
VFAIASNLAADLAWWTGFSFTAVSVFCILFMFWLRSYVRTVRRRNEIVVQKWQGVLFQSFQVGKDLEACLQPKRRGRPPKKPVTNPEPIEQQIEIPHKKLSRRDLPHFLFLWNYLHESLRGKTKEPLNFIAENLHLAELTLRLFKSFSLKNKLLAIYTFSNLRDRKVTDKLEKLLSHPDPILSLWAMNALLRIDPEKTFRVHFSQIAKREDWSPVILSRIFREIGSDTITEPLLNLAKENYGQRVGERMMARLISYLALAHAAAYLKFVNQVLTESKEKEVLIACLRLVHSNDILPRVRELLTDDRWQVRMQVVLTLGRLGRAEDTDLLIDSLNDVDWWVRYRTACALVSMPNMTIEKLTELSETLPNQFSRDILRHVLAEVESKCLIQPSSFTLSR